MGLKSNQTLMGYFHKFCATIEPLHILPQTYIHVIKIILLFLKKKTVFIFLRNVEDDLVVKSIC